MTILTEYSSAWILLALLLGGGYAFLLYFKQEIPWGKKWQRAMAALRFVWVTMIAILLVGLLVQQFVTRYEKPLLVFAIDNSESIPLQTDSIELQNTIQNLQNTATQLREKGFEVAFRTLNHENKAQETEQISFEERSSPISSMLKGIETEYENQNLANVVLLSDGAYNQGLAPDISPYSFSLQTLGIGDTIPKKDIILRNLFHNKIAYLGNKFPIVAELTHIGFEGQEIDIVLSQNGKRLSIKKVRFSDNADELKSVEFLIEANSTGIQHYVVQVLPKENEFTRQNNIAHAYIDIIDSKEKILLVAAAPHPDIKAFRLAIEKNENYQFDVVLPYLRPYKLEDKYDLVIFHQFPAQIGKSEEVIQNFRKRANSELFVTGKLTSYNILNELNLGVRVNPMGKQSDKVIPFWNSNFSKFYLTDEQKDRFADYPPATVPFANYSVSQQSDVMLYQRVGSIETKKPLVVLNENNEKKVGVWLAENTWQWRLGEYATNSSHEGYDVLLSKVIQYLSTKENKRFFNVSPVSSEFSTSDKVAFNVEVYNKIYEPLAGKNIRLEIKDEKGKTRTYTFTNSTSPFRYSAAELPEGAYSFRASTTIDGKSQISVGEFVVKEVKLESLNATADFSLLRRLASQNQGLFYTQDQLQILSDSLLRAEPTPTIYRNEELSDVINSWWIMLLIIGLASFEWGVRKYTGGY